MLDFSVGSRDPRCEARTGTMVLPHGPVETPVFMPVGTQGTVKALTMDMVKDLGFSLILGNTYHLYIRPGNAIIKAHGGLHGFSRWNGNILTDSGGFQVFSLSPLRSIKPEGVSFRSHIDGSRLFFTPESVVRIQQDFNSDIQMALDVCTAPEITHKKAREAMIITNNWASRARDEFRRAQDEGYLGNLFGIVQGNFFQDLRMASAEHLSSLDLPGYAIGGLSVGEPFAQFVEYLAFTAPLLPADRPRYLMGIGTPEYILEAVEYGMDMFDCVFPTRVARNGTFFTRQGRLVIKHEKYKEDLSPVDSESPIASFSRSYLRHLFKSQEILGPILASQHNLWFLERMMREIRVAIREGRFQDYKRAFLATYGEGNG